MEHIPELLAIALREGHLDVAIRRVRHGHEPIEPVVGARRLVEEHYNLRAPTRYDRQLHAYHAVDSRTYIALPQFIALPRPSRLLTNLGRIAIDDAHVAVPLVALKVHLLLHKVPKHWKLTESCS